MRSFLTYLGATVLAFIVALPALAQTTVTLQDGVNSYGGTTDSRITSSSPTTNEGGNSYYDLITPSSTSLLIRFAIFASEGGPVPNGATILSATLSLWEDWGPASVFKAARVRKNWQEMQVTWNQAANGTNWTTPGIYDATDVLPSADGEGTSASATAGNPGWLNIDVSSGVQAFAAGSANYGWKFSWVSGPNSSNAKTFLARNDNQSSGTKRPKLVITYNTSGLTAPQDLDGSVSGTTVNLHWRDIANETQYKIERKTGQAGTYAQIGTVTANVVQYADSTVSSGNTYFYRVRGSNGTGDGPYSADAGVFVTTTSNDGTTTLEFTYDPFGNVVQTKAAGAITTTITYDVRGRKTSTTDPDMGNWVYTYNALGELKSQTDAKGQTVTMTYDLIGRMTNRTEPDLVTNWTYDACTMGVGKLCQVSSDNSYSRTQTYDSLGRLSQVTVSLSGATDTVTYGYDGASRMTQITYPTGFIAKNVYNNFGHLLQVTDNAGSTVYWQADLEGPTGRVLSETLGNGLTTSRAYDVTDRLTSGVVNATGGALQNLAFSYDDIGNVTTRTDAVDSVTENFGYDKLNRLEVSSGPTLGTKTYSYDAHGNILYKSDVGTYSYGAKPHAVSSIAGTLNTSFGYDLKPWCSTSSR